MTIRGFFDIIHLKYLILYNSLWKSLIRRNLVLYPHSVCYECFFMYLFSIHIHVHSIIVLLSSFWFDFSVDKGTILLCIVQKPWWTNIPVFPLLLTMTRTSLISSVDLSYCFPLCVLSFSCPLTEIKFLRSVNIPFSVLKIKTETKSVSVPGDPLSVYVKYCETNRIIQTGLSNINRH